MVSSGYQSLVDFTCEGVEITEVPIQFMEAGGSGAFYGFEVDNTRNNRDSFLKLWENGGSHPPLYTVPDVGFIPPTHVFRVRAGKSLGISYFNAGVPGVGFLFVACVTTGGTAGKTPPANPVFLTMKIDD
jgi:hypothetical protein